MEKNNCFIKWTRTLMFTVEATHLFISSYFANISIKIIPYTLSRVISKGQAILYFTISYIYRSLKCDRTRIHRNLFIAIIIHVIVSLCMHIDEFVAKSQGTQIGGSVVDDKVTISNTVSFIKFILDGFFMISRSVLRV